MKIKELAPSDGIYETTPDYIHGIEAGGASNLVFIAGTMGLKLGGEPGADIEEQLSLVWRNIRRILAEAGMTVDNIVRVTTYLTDAAHADLNGAARVQAMKGRVVPTTAIVAKLLSPGWLIEIEAIAAA